MVYISYGTAVSITTEKLETCFLVQVPWQGTAEVIVNNITTVIRPGLASVISPQQSMYMHWSEDCSFFTVRLDRGKVERTLANLLGHELQAPLVFDPMFDFSTPEGQSWLNAVTFVKKQLELPLASKVAEPLLQQLENTMCLMLLQLPHHNYQELLLEGTSAVTPKTIKRARSFIHENIHQTISLTQLAEITGVAQATLNKHFIHFIGQSPMKYIRNEKLSAIHDLLSSTKKEIRVTDVALMYGFNHLGRFAEYYKRRYGELPSETYLKFRSLACR